MSRSPVSLSPWSSDALTCPACVFSIHFHRHLLLPGGRVGGRRGCVGGLCLWFLLVPSAGLAGRIMEVKRAGYWLRKGNASAGNFAWERDEHRPHSVHLTAATLPAPLAKLCPCAGGGAALGDQGWFRSWLLAPAESPVLGFAAPFVQKGYFRPRRLIIRLY